MRCGTTDQVDVGSVLIVEDGHDIVELAKDLIVARHVGGQDAADDSFTHALVAGAAQVAEDVGRRIVHDVERHRAVVVLQRRDVVVAQCQLRACVYLPYICSCRISFMCVRKLQC